ncbi:hypothetical protein [Reyranella sp. CPCC 100927]|uniref:hypothetical protein n=1 Tax=Reyranella sp. CPCC 100927 TaxID=2599616 RepID=UPI0011B58727|nr:hypothetical protein [Reyranella sp. CPCC 100927]TWT15624.1 hypothetical protein FQU96_04550 [Reyranella sp. CPCC 100927]
MSEVDALLLSCAIEAPVAAILAWALRWGHAGRAALAATLATLMTHGIAWRAILWLLEGLGYPLAVLLVETGVVAAEAIAYRLIVPLDLRRALAVSLIANAASTGAGLALYAFGLA